MAHDLPAGLTDLYTRGEWLALVETNNKLLVDQSCPLCPGCCFCCCLWLFGLIYKEERYLSRLRALIESENTRLASSGLQWQLSQPHWRHQGELMTLIWMPNRKEFEQRNPHRRPVSTEYPPQKYCSPDQLMAQGLPIPPHLLPPAGTGALIPLATDTVVLGAPMSLLSQPIGVQPLCAPVPLPPPGPTQESMGVDIQMMHMPVAHTQPQSTPYQHTLTPSQMSHAPPPPPPVNTHDNPPAPIDSPVAPAAAQAAAYYEPTLIVAPPVVQHQQCQYDEPPPPYQPPVYDNAHTIGAPPPASATYAVTQPANCTHCGAMRDYAIDQFCRKCGAQ